MKPEINPYESPVVVQDEWPRYHNGIRLFDEPRPDFLYGERWVHGYARRTWAFGVIIGWTYGVLMTLIVGFIVGKFL